MGKFLYYLRINAALLIGLFIALPFVQKGGSIRHPASVPSVEGDSCRIHFRSHAVSRFRFKSIGAPLSEKIPDFEKHMATLEESTFTVKNFASYFFERNQRWPTVKETLEKLVTGHNRIMKNLKSIPTKDPHDPEVRYYILSTAKALEFSQKERDNFARFASENSHLMDEPFNPNENTSYQLLEQIERLWKNPFGDIGEFLTAMRMPGVEAQNIHLRWEPTEGYLEKAQIHQERFVTATQNLLIKLERTSAAELLEIKRRFPHVFNGLRENDWEALKQWLESKEIDLIINSSQGKFTLLEVKNYKRVMDLHGLQEEFKGKKSILRQQKEIKEIIELLGLGDTYFPAITFIKGIKEDAIRALEEAGIMVIDTNF